MPTSIGGSDTFPADGAASDGPSYEAEDDEEEDERASNLSLMSVVGMKKARKGAGRVA